MCFLGYVYLGRDFNVCGYFCTFLKFVSILKFVLGHDLGCVIAEN